MRRVPFPFACALALVACAGRSARHADTAPPEPPSAPPRADANVGTSWTLAGLARGAVLLPDLGSHHRAVTTTSSEAQAWFDQGLALTYGFNHDEAARSYARAAELDPGCAMCFWGVAYTLGPNYNVPMLPERARTAWEAIVRAQGLAAERATPVEAALIGALARRYRGPEYVDPARMQAYSERYAAAMKEVARTFQDDLDAQVLYAEALMDVRPWKLWLPDGAPAEGTEELLTTLESVLARAPGHPGANHYYIHAVEASPRPDRGLAAAERLPGLMPGAGHMVHMPAHIYQRVGRYEAAAAANRRAIEVDLRYLATVEPPGYYSLYVSHNHGFLAYATAMEGRAAESLAAAREAAKSLSTELVCTMPGMDFFQSMPLLVMVRFGRWEQALAEPSPPERHQTLVALWHHARGMALAATGDPAGAFAQAAAIRGIAGELPEAQLAGLNNGRTVLELAAQVVEARAAEAERAPDAIARWEKAVALADTLAYSEPADWFTPVRHHLGAALLDAGRARDAEAVYRADLERNPDNGWALFGLWQALAAQQQRGAAEAAERRFRGAWKRADVELRRSAF